MTHNQTQQDACSCYPRLPLTPPEGWTVDNLPLADLPRSAELIRGALIMSPPTSWHQAVVSALMALIHAQCPHHFRVHYRMAVKRSERTAPEPDISVVHASAHDLDRLFYEPDDVVLAAEVMTPESEERDREDKPGLYASMGIPNFWLIERQPDDAPTVHEHRLHNGAYQLKKKHRGRLVTRVPFPIDIPLTDPCPPLDKHPKAEL